MDCRRGVSYHYQQVKLSRCGRRTTRLRLINQVVWNCHEEGAKKMADMEDSSWQRYVCAEVAAIGEPIQLAPQETWVASQTIQLQFGDSKY